MTRFLRILRSCAGAPGRAAARPVESEHNAQDAANPFSPDQGRAAADRTHSTADVAGQPQASHGGARAATHHGKRVVRASLVLVCGVGRPRLSGMGMGAVLQPSIAGSAPRRSEGFGRGLGIRAIVAGVGLERAAVVALGSAAMGNLQYEQCHDSSIVSSLRRPALAGRPRRRSLAGGFARAGGAPPDQASPGRSRRVVPRMRLRPPRHARPLPGVR
jgi:hypothetical protein